MRNHTQWAMLLSAACWAVCVVLTPCFAQITFERKYGGPESDCGYSVRQTYDGGYVVAGETRSFGAGFRDVFLIRTDSLGDTLWTATYGGASGDYGYSVLQTSDRGFAIAGHTSSMGSGRYDVYLVKTDSLGDTVWTKTYGDTLENRGLSVGKTVDGGYVISGWTNTEYSSDMYLIRTDSLGNTVWEETYGGIDNQRASSCEQTSDGGYIAVGWSSLAAGYSDIYVVKTDSSGGLLWSNMYGDWSWELGWSVKQTFDQGFIIAGETWSTIIPNVYLIRTDSLGNSIWVKIYGDTLPAYGHCVVQTLDGGYAVSGTSAFSQMVRGEVLLMRTDSLGNELWTRTYAGPIGQEGYSVEQTSDGGFIVAGEIYTYDSNVDVYLIKTDSDGLVARDVAVLDLDAPADTVFTDSVCQVSATVTNLLPGWPWCEVIATIDEYADTVRVIALEQDSMHLVTFSDWQIPSGDSTTYTMTACARTAGDIDTTNDCMQKTIFAYDPTGVLEEHDRPGGADFRLCENHPNPFHRSTVISYSLPHVCDATLTIYDITGRLVETLVNATQQPGTQQVRWNRKDEPSGVYFCRLRAGDFVETRKMVVVE